MVKIPEVSLSLRQIRSCTHLLLKPFSYFLSPKRTLWLASCNDGELFIMLLRRYAMDSGILWACQGKNGPRVMGPLHYCTGIGILPNNSKLGPIEIHEEGGERKKEIYIQLTLIWLREGGNKVSHFSFHPYVLLAVVSEGIPWFIALV